MAASSPRSGQGGGGSSSPVSPQPSGPTVKKPRLRSKGEQVRGQTSLGLRSGAGRGVGAYFEGDPPRRHLALGGSFGHRMRGSVSLAGTEWVEWGMGMPCVPLLEHGAATLLPKFSSVALIRRSVVNLWLLSCWVSDLAVCASLIGSCCPGHFLTCGGGRWSPWAPRASNSAILARVERGTARGRSQRGGDAEARKIAIEWLGSPFFRSFVRARARVCVCACGMRTPPTRIDRIPTRH